MFGAIPNAILSFTIALHERHWPNPRWIIVPNINAVSLTDLVEEFERQEQFDPPLGGYAGLIPEYFNFGRLDRYFLNEFEPDSYFTKYPVYLLGCKCGEVGCWPLTCQIKIDPETVTWHRFMQPDRRERDYSQFGPFVVDGEQYRRTVVDLWADYSARIAKDRR